ncbi:MAG: MFS transporter [Chlamydiales bacterium]|nr:MFS transporter [Chlamydiales bacterium]
MSEDTRFVNIRFIKTRNAVFITELLNEPLWTLFYLFVFILHKDLHASAFQVGLFTMLRPVVGIASMYWSSTLARKPHKVLSNLIWSGILSRVAFFFFPFIDNPWIFLISVIFYATLKRGGVPAWLEILKMNLPKKSRGNIISWSSALGYVEGIALAIGVGYMLDHHSGSWRWMFPVSAFIGILGVFLQARIPLEGIKKEVPEEDHFCIKKIIDPWKDAYLLLKERQDYRFFQVGVMICGVGIMVIQPALPIFFLDVLGLSYTDLAIALSVWRGVGYAFTSPIWGKLFSRFDIYKLCFVIFVLMGLFPICLLAATTNVIWVYIAYLIYGSAQAGFHLCWNLAGPMFSQDKNSSPFSSVMLLMMGIRGCFAPPLGSLLVVLFGPVLALVAGVLFCSYSSIRMLQREKRKIVLIEDN